MTTITWLGIGLAALLIATLLMILRSSREKRKRSAIKDLNDWFSARCASEDDGLWVIPVFLLFMIALALIACLVKEILSSMQ